MTQEFFQTRTFCGRQYQTWSLSNQVNLAPVDEVKPNTRVEESVLIVSQDEEQRLNLQHDLLKLLFAQRVQPLIPDSIANPAHILDCAYGTGRWASELATIFPDSQVEPNPHDDLVSDQKQVTGIDICPIFVQQNDRPDNFVPEVR